MAQNIGYERAEALAREQLAQKDPAQLAQGAGVKWNGTDFIIPWMGEEITLEQGKIEQRIIWMHYLLAQGPKTPRGRHMAYKQAPGAAIYNANFHKRCVDPLVKTFSPDLEGFLKLGEQLGATKDKPGDISITLHPLPHVPLTLVLWEGDDEFPASGNVLFDETACEWFCAEDLVVYASLPIYQMIKMHYQRLAAENQDKK